MHKSSINVVHARRNKQRVYRSVLSLSQGNTILKQKNWTPCAKVCLALYVIGDANVFLLTNPPQLQHTCTVQAPRGSGRAVILA